MQRKNAESQFRHFVLLRIKIKLVSFFAGSHATGTNILFGFYSVDFYADLMNVSIEAALGSTIRVAHVITANSTFSAYYTYFAHKTPPIVYCYKNISHLTITCKQITRVLAKIFRKI